MKKLKVMTVVGTRPEIIRLSRVMARLDDDRQAMVFGHGVPPEFSRAYHLSISSKQRDSRSRYNCE